ncbi:hypothetical protein Tco_1528319 [Tanacetum coccineum]
MICKHQVQLGMFTVSNTLKKIHVEGGVLDLNNVTQASDAINDAWHDNATIFKVKGLEAVDQAIGQLARLLNEGDSSSFSKPPSKNN